MASVWQALLYLYSSVSFWFIKVFLLIEHLELSTSQTAARNFFETIAGYGLGGSTVSLFARVGGGFYKKAADVGADLAGKVCQGLEEDSPDNPGIIAGSNYLSGDLIAQYGGIKINAN